VTAIAGLALFFALIGLAQHHDATQWAVYTEGNVQLRSPEAREVYCGDKDGAQCDAAIAQEAEWNAEFGSELVREHPYGAATQHPIAAAGVAAGWMSSLLGVILSAALAAVLVGGEWASGTARVRLARTPSRWRFPLATFVSVWTALLGLTAALWLSLAAAGPLLRHLYAVPPMSVDWSPARYTGEQTARALVILTLCAALATGVALLVRNPLGSFAVTSLLGLAAIASSASRAAIEYSPGFWLASWMHYTPQGAWRDHVWPDTFPLGNALDPVPQDPALGLVGLLGSLVVVAVLTLTIFARRDIRR
jgi:hypothetical protein